MDTDKCEGFLQPWTLVRLIVESFFAVLTVIGNLVVISSILFVKILRKNKNYLLLSLAVADLLVGVLVVPFKIIQEAQCFVWFAKSRRCYLMIPVSVDILCCTASILTLTAIAVDRYVAISRPLFYKINSSGGKTVVVIAITWLIALLITVPYWGQHEIHRAFIGPYLFSVCQAKQSDWWRIIQTFVSFIVPLILMIVTYAKIWHILRTRTKRKELGRQRSFPELEIKTDKNNQRQKSATEALLNTLREKKGCAMLGVMIGFFVICWLPFFTLIGIVALGEVIGKPLNPPPLTYELLVWLGYLNSSINPFVYTMFSSQFRRAFKGILTCNFRGLISSQIGSNRHYVNSSTRLKEQKSLM